MVISAHFPPKMDPEDCARVCKEAVGFLERSGAIFKFLQGDLNVAPGRVAGGGGGFSKALAPRGSRASMVCPYPPGSPTNIVPLRSGHVSRKVTDWLLAHKNTPVTVCWCESLPELSTHLAMVVHIGVGSELCRPQDPTVRRFHSPLVCERDLALTSLAWTVMLHCLHVGE